MPLKTCGCGRQARRVPCRKCKAANPPERRAYSGTAEERQMRVDVVETYGDRCAYCHVPVDLAARHGADTALVLAHVIPHADGGAFTLDNLRPAHALCNRRAGARPPDA